MCNKLQVNIGDRFGNLIIIEEAQKKGNDRYFRCQCDCGNTKNILLYSLTKRNRNTISCGCMVGKDIIHGNSRHYLYTTYINILDRCNNIKNRYYKNYGGRGIKCEWNSFEEFFKDMGDKPNKIYSIDRINVNGNYCKENCRWANSKEQGRNKTNNSYLTYNGKTMCLAEWCEELGVKKIWL